MIKIFESYGAKRENLQLRLVGRAVLDIRNNGKISPDVLKSILDYDIPVLCNAKNDLILLSAKYGDVESLELLKPYFSFVNAEELMYGAFSSYELNEVIHRKNVDELLAITDIFIDAGKVKSSIL